MSSINVLKCNDCGTTWEVNFITGENAGKPCPKCNTSNTSFVRSK